MVFIHSRSVRLQDCGFDFLNLKLYVVILNGVLSIISPPLFHHITALPINIYSLGSYISSLMRINKYKQIQQIKTATECALNAIL